MGRKAGLDLDDVVDVAVQIADRDGLEAATLSAVARELGIKTPSLYNHVDGLEGLRRQLAMRGAAILRDEITAAVGDKAGASAMRFVATAYREFATRHPGLYDSFLPAPRPDEDPELYEAMGEPVRVIARSLGDTGVPSDASIHVIRAMRATLHGFIDLEANGGFGMPVDIDRSFEVALDVMIAGVEASANANR